MKTLFSEILVAAPPERVWEVLVDLARYPEWNPFLVSASGQVREGERLEIRFQPPGGRALTMRPTVTRARPAEALEWLGRLAVPGLFDGRHIFELHRAPGGTRLVQREEFRGLLVPLLARSLDRHTARGFVAMNEALKARVEQAVAGPTP